MAKIKVKLSEKLDKNGLGFFDISTGKKIAPKEFKKGETFEVEDSSFVQSKIESRELIFVEKVEEKKEEPTKK